MVVHKVLDPLDEPKASLRTLFILSKHVEGLNVMALHEEMKSFFGVGRPATDTSYTALVGAGLVEVAEGWSGRHKVKIVKLTERGKRVAIELRKIISILQNDDESTVSFESGETSRH